MTKFLDEAADGRGQRREIAEGEEAGTGAYRARVTGVTMGERLLC